MLQPVEKNVISELDKMRLKKPRRASGVKKSGARADIVRVGEVPTPERMKKDTEFGGVIKTCEPEHPKSAVKVLKHRSSVECWLDRYKRKGLLDDSEFAAGIMFRSAWLTTIFGIRTQEARMSVGSSAPFDFEAALDNLRGSERIVRLCLKKLSPMQKLAVITCCGQDEALKSKERVQTLRRALEAITRKSKELTESDNNFLARRMEEFI